MILNVTLLENRLNKQQFRGLLVCMDGDFRITFFEDGWGYQLVVHGKSYESYNFKTRKEAYLDAKKTFQEVISV